MGEEPSRPLLCKHHSALLRREAIVYRPMVRITQPSSLVPLRATTGGQSPPFKKSTTILAPPGGLVTRHLTIIILPSPRLLSLVAPEHRRRLQVLPAVVVAEH
jgi:hypothetical protein